MCITTSGCFPVYFSPVSSTGRVLRNQKFAGGVRGVSGQTERSSLTVLLPSPVPTVATVAEHRRETQAALVSRQRRRTHPSFPRPRDREEYRRSSSYPEYLG